MLSFLFAVRLSASYFPIGHRKVLVERVLDPIFICIITGEDKDGLNSFSGSIRRTLGLLRHLPRDTVGSSVFVDVHDPRTTWAVCINVLVFEYMLCLVLLVKLECKSSELLVVES